MARTPDGPVALTERITLRATKSWIAVLDRNRGKKSRGAFIRQLVQDLDNERRGNHGKRSTQGTQEVGDSPAAGAEDGHAAPAAGDEAGQEGVEQEG